METYTLSNGMQIPRIGLGTWLLDNDQVEQAVINAVKTGYRHIDTAQAYQNEDGVGRGVSACNIPRDQLFITTKVAAEHKTYESAAASIESSLAALQTGYVDLMLIHAPQPWKEFRSDSNHDGGNLEAWRAMEDAVDAGKVKAIGVSNFLRHDLENILSHCRIKPVVNQVLAHVGNTPFDLIDFCRSQDILVEAYSPIAHGAVLNQPLVKEMADCHQVSVAQICLRYCLQLGLLPLPKTANSEHMRSNLTLDFTLSEEEMTQLKSMKKLDSYGEHSFFPVFATQLKGE